MKKIVIIINGAGGVGKDTICKIVATHYRVKIISAIDPIKQIAAHGGWNYDDKSLKGRKLLSDLKGAFIEYNDLPLNYLMKEYSEFLTDPNEILFVHIREPGEINKFKGNISLDCITLLVVSDEADHLHFGNQADDEVRNYNYDYTYPNTVPLSALAEDFMLFFETIRQRITGIET